MSSSLPLSLDGSDLSFLETVMSNIVIWGKSRPLRYKVPESYPLFKLHTIDFDILY